MNFDVDRPQPDHFLSSRTEVEAFDLVGIGKIKIFFAHEGSIEIGSETKTYVPYVSIDFDHPRSFEQIDNICTLLDSLFSFLTMTAVRPAELTLTPSGMQPDAIGHHTLLRSGVRWNTGSNERRYSNFLSRSDVPSVKTLITDTVNAHWEASFLLEAINESLHFAKRCDSSFGLIFPKLERFLDKWFSGDDEANYLNKEKKFFEYVNASDDEEVVSFCQKHIEIKKSKKRGIKQKLRVAIKTLNNSVGCDIDAAVAGRIVEFRQSQFHAPGLKSIIKSYEHCEEVSKVCEFMMIAFILEVLKINRATYTSKLRAIFPELFA